MQKKKKKSLKNLLEQAAAAISNLLNFHSKGLHGAGVAHIDIRLEISVSKDLLVDTMQY